METAAGTADKQRELQQMVCVWRERQMKSERRKAKEGVGGGRKRERERKRESLQKLRTQEQRK